MATSKSRAKKSSRGAARAGGMAAMSGRAPRGQEWNPSQPESEAPSVREVNVPRPYTSRYPISNEAFEKLKKAAPKAKLPKVTAELARDKGKKSELGALTEAPAALTPRQSAASARAVARKCAIVFARFIRPANAPRLQPSTSAGAANGR